MLVVGHKYCAQRMILTGGHFFPIQLVLPYISTANYISNINITPLPGHKPTETLGVHKKLTID